MPKASRSSTRDLNQMADLYAAGWATHQIAARFATDSGTVSYHFKRLGVCCRTNAEIKRRYTVREDAFSSLGDADTAYWLGFFCLQTAASTLAQGAPSEGLL
jgi:hypothetical protein